MSPIAFSLSSGSEFKSGLAWALIGGLISSLMLTLVLVPVVYSKVDQWRVALTNLRSPFVTGKAKRVMAETQSIPLEHVEEAGVNSH